MGSGAIGILVKFLATIWGIGLVFAYTAPLFDYQNAYTQGMGGFAAVSFAYVISNRQFVLFVFPILCAVVAVQELFGVEDNSTYGLSRGMRGGRRGR